MNKRTIAAFAVLLLAFTALVPLAAVDTTADDTNNKITATSGLPFPVQVNMNEYTSYNPTHSWTVEEENETATIWGNKGQKIDNLSNITFSVSEEGNGLFVITATLNEGTTDDIDVVLTWNTEITINGVGKTMSLVYNLTVNHLEETTKLTFKNDIITGFVGTAINEKLEYRSNGSFTNTGKWYAQGLPAGLSMNSNGTIEGVPTQEVTEKTVTITVSDDDGGVIGKGTVFITITEGSGSNFSFEVIVGSNDPSSETTVIAYTGETVTLTTKVREETNNVDSVFVIDAEGSKSVLTGDEGVYTIPTGSETSKNTGAYVVTMKYGVETKNFTLFVVAEPTDISTGVIIIGGSTGSTAGNGN